MNNQNPSLDCLRSICFLALEHRRHLPLARGQKHASPSSCLLFIPLVWGQLALEFLQDPCLEPLALHLFFISTIAFMISLIGSVVNTVKSCTTSRHTFSLAGTYCFRFESFQSFYHNNNGISGVIFPDFPDILSGFFSIV